MKIENSNQILFILTIWRTLLETSLDVVFMPYNE